MTERNKYRPEKEAQPQKRVRAAQYVRMSTDHQEYSTDNQADAIHQYAAARAIDIVKTYADEGKSGLRIDGRESFQRLIADVQSGKADFEAILVYDVSRWGRFQDTDESAYYEYICKRSGVSVHYCAEQFENDGSPIAAIIKGVKSAMAGEYSRELSVKVFAGQRRHIELGHRQGGPAGYGLRRALIDQSGNFKAELVRGEHKSIQTDRVVLVAGPDEEIAVVREIYRRFVEDLVPERQIVDELNTRGIVTDLGRSWTRGMVHQVLINEKYIGNNVWNRASFKLKKKRVRNSPDMWIRAEGAFPAIIGHHLFDAAQTIIRQRSFRLSDEEMLEALRKLRQDKGLLSGLIIDEAEGLPSSSAYSSRFGSLLQAYKLVGYTPKRDYRYVEISRHLRALHPDVLNEILDGLRAVGCQFHTIPQTELISVNGELTISIVVARCHRTPGGSYRWRLRFDVGLQPDITIAIRMDAANKAPLDYYLLPRIDIASEKLKLAEENGLSLDGYRFDSLEPFYDFLRPEIVTEAA